MVIAILSDEIFPFSLGGMQKHSSNLAKFLAKQGVNVLIFTYLPSNIEKGQLESFFTQEELAKITLISVKQPKGNRFPGHYIYESYHFSKNIYSELLKFGIEKIDFIYAQGFTGWYTMKQRNSGFPKVGVNFHGLEMYQQTFGWKGKLQQLLFRPFVKRNIQKADLYFSLGAKITEICKKIVPSAKVYEVPVAVDDKWSQLSPVQMSSNQKRLVFIGRYERRKGLEELIQALNRLANHSAAFTIDFIGKFPNSITDELNKTIQATFHGPIYDEQQIQHLFLSSDVLVCPSYSEGMPTVIIEAMACSNAILASNVGAVADLVDSKNGWLIQPGNVDELANKIEAILRMDKINLNNMKEASRVKFLHSFKWSIVAQKTLEIIQSNTILNK